MRYPREKHKDMKSVDLVRRPFLSYTGRGAFFLFGKAKRKNGGRNTQVMSFERQLLTYTIYSIVFNSFTAMKPFSSLLTKNKKNFLAKSQKSS